MTNVFKDIKYKPTWIMNIPWGDTSHGYAISEVHLVFESLKFNQIGLSGRNLTNFNRFFLWNCVDYLKPFLISHDTWRSYEKLF